MVSLTTDLSIIILPITEYDQTWIVQKKDYKTHDLIYIFEMSANLQSYFQIPLYLNVPEFITTRFVSIRINTIFSEIRWYGNDFTQQRPHHNMAHSLRPLHHLSHM